jgi:hypothetical protein
LVVPTGENDPHIHIQLESGPMPLT